MKCFPHKRNTSLDFEDRDRHVKVLFVTRNNFLNKNTVLELNISPEISGKETLILETGSNVLFLC